MQSLSKDNSVYSNVFLTLGLKRWSNTLTESIVILMALLLSAVQDGAEYLKIALQCVLQCVLRLGFEDMDEHLNLVLCYIKCYSASFICTRWSGSAAFFKS